MLASYARDALAEVDGVHGLVESHLPGRRGVRVSVEDDVVRLELHVCLEWGASVERVGRAVQERVREFLARMADVEPAAVDVVVAEFAAP
ncbi:MAG: Asp23 family, cell envelope-related function [Gaiellaceae bacterium]|nr:Asp23 family, cell envelope-related function [Gaiellaceae bacterium]